MPTKSSIQEGVYLSEYCGARVLGAIKLPVELIKPPGGQAAFCDVDSNDPTKRELSVVSVGEFFRLQEGKLLHEGEDKVGRLRELHDQIEILRGATLNGVILLSLSLFGLCALYRARLNNAESDNKISSKLRILRKCALYAPAVAFLFIGLIEMGKHFAKPPASQIAGAKIPLPHERHSDPPLAEGVIVLLGVGGLCLRLTDDSPRLFRNLCLMAAVLTLIGYGSWWWTEVLYDQLVIHSSPPT